MLDGSLEPLAVPWGCAVEHVRESERVEASRSTALEELRRISPRNLQRGGRPGSMTAKEELGGVRVVAVGVAREPSLQPRAKDPIEPAR